MTEFLKKWLEKVFRKWSYLCFLFYAHPWFYYWLSQYVHTFNQITLLTIMPNMLYLWTILLKQIIEIEPILFPLIWTMTSNIYYLLTMENNVWFIYEGHPWEFCHFKVTLSKFYVSSSILLSALTIQQHSLAYVKKKIKFFGLPVLFKIRWIS